MPNDITVILTVYRRLHLLDQQIKSIRQQTVKPKEIWVWQNFHEEAGNHDKTTYDVDAWFGCNKNWKFFGRFAAAMLATTQYIAFFDDDTIPGNHWLQNCLTTHAKTPGILGGAGVILNSLKYQQHTRCGWPTQNDDTTEVDLVGHAWFLEKKILKYLWEEEPPTWDTGEDLFLSYSAQKYGNIKTYCPPHPADKLHLHSSIHPHLGVDNKTISVTNHQLFYGSRNKCVQHACNHGWHSVRGIEKL